MIKKCILYVFGRSEMDERNTNENQTKATEYKSGNMLARYFAEQIDRNIAACALLPSKMLEQFIDSATVCAPSNVSRSACNQYTNR